MSIMFVLMQGGPNAVVDDYTKELYQTYCAACHTTSATGAPQSFDQKAWSLRLKAGIEQVTTNAIVGKGNMPPMGSCQECEYEDLQTLIHYMASSQALHNNATKETP